MYEAAPELDRLRQGDVISDCYLPRYSLGSTILLAKTNAQGGLEFDNRLILNARPGKAIILSQCCEFNEGKRNGFSIARIISLTDTKSLPKWGINLAEILPISRTVYRSGSKSIQLQELRTANQISLETNENAAVNVFLLDADGYHLNEPHIVDFTQVTSIKMEDKALILTQKVLQLDDSTRRQFQTKLGYFYARRAK